MYITTPLDGITQRQRNENEYSDMQTQMRRTIAEKNIQKIL